MRWTVVLTWTPDDEADNPTYTTRRLTQDLQCIAAELEVLCRRFSIDSIDVKEG